MSRLKEKYYKEVVPALMKEFNYKNPMAVPRIKAVVLNMGLGEATRDIKIIESAVEELTLIAGQRAVVTRARKSIAAFKLRKGMPIGVKVTLRRKRMWDFLDKFFNIALPRVRDFRGISDKIFDGHGNCTIGIREHTIFPEVNLDKVDKIKGMNVTIVTTAKTDIEAYYLLKYLGMPFRK